MPCLYPLRLTARARELGVLRGPHFLDSLIHIVQEAIIHSQAPEWEGLVGLVTSQSWNSSSALGVQLVCGRSQVPLFRLPDPGVQAVHLEGGSPLKEGWTTPSTPQPTLAQPIHFT